ncbi:MAG: hypothetical protein U9Q69_05980 [Nanoarchaeota archaeon]|nr:hypothetical protein [Nanoarchaeota archaeon]
MENWAVMLIWLTFGAVAGMLYVLRRIFLLEKEILKVEQSVLRMEKIQIRMEKMQLEALGYKRKNKIRKKK